MVLKAEMFFLWSWLQNKINRKDRLRQNSWNILIILHSFFRVGLILFSSLELDQYQNKFSISHCFAWFLFFSDVVLPCYLLQGGSWQTQGNPQGGRLGKHHSYVHIVATLIFWNVWNLMSVSGWRWSMAISWKLSAMCFSALLPP